MKNMSLAKKRTAIFIIVVTISVLLALLIAQKRAEAPVVQDGVVTADTLTVDDQKEGTTVRIERVSMKQAGYIVVHKDFMGTPFDVLGVSEYLAAGEHEDVEVTLLAESKEGDTMIALIHADNGDGVFTPADDTSVQNEEKKNVMAPFTVK